MFCHPYSNREENTSPRAVETVSRDDKGERKANHHNHHHHHHNNNHRKKTRHNKLVVFVFVLLHGPFKTTQYFYSLFRTMQRQAVRLSDVNMGVTQTPFDCHIYWFVSPTEGISVIVSEEQRDVY